MAELGRIDSFKAPFSFFDVSEEGLFGSFNTIVSNIYTFLTLVGGISFILYFVLGALNWLTAGGKQDKVEKAKSMMTDAAIGVIILVLSYPIVYIIGRILGLDILHPEKVLPFLKPAGSPEFAG